LTLGGYPENDLNIIEGTYTFWGHEHLYGVAGQSSTSAAAKVALQLNGGTFGSPADDIVDYNGGGAIEAELSKSEGAAGISYGIDPYIMNCDKNAGGDTGYPSQLSTP
jgi:hypothetical protein